MSVSQNEGRFFVHKQRVAHTACSLRGPDGPEGAKTKGVNKHITCKNTSGCPKMMGPYCEQGKGCTHCMQPEGS